MLDPLVRYDGGNVDDVEIENFVVSVSEIVPVLDRTEGTLK